MKKWRSVFSRAALIACAAFFVTACHREAGPAKGTLMIAVVTDYSTSDAALGELKGSILAIQPHAQLIDVASNLEPFNTLQASYILNDATHDFPSGTIIVAAVAPNQTPVKPPVLLLMESGKFYVGPNNGVFSMILNREKLVRAWELDKPEFFRGQQPSSGFIARDILGPIAAHLLAGASPKTLGTQIKRADLEILPNINASVSGPNITAQVMHIDNFGNLVTNISADQAAFIKEGNLVKISVGSEVSSGPLVKNFAELPKGRVGLVYNGQNLLQVCVSQGSAAKQFNAKVGSTITIRQ